MRKTDFTWAIEMQLVRYEHAEDGCCVGEARSGIDTLIILDTKEDAEKTYPEIFKAALEVGIKTDKK